MISKFPSVLLIIFFISISRQTFGFEKKLIEFNPHDRILICAPHPDDETLGAGGIIQHAVDQNIPVKVIYLTNGDSNELSFLVHKKRPVILPKGIIKMGELRKQEAVNAMALLGLTRSDLIFLGYPDGGTLRLFTSFWNSPKPYRSLLTRVTKVPYPDAKRPGAAYTAEDITRDLKDIIIDFKPTKIFISSPLDSNPDHRAFYLFLQIVLWDLEKTLAVPEIFPFMIHYDEWPVSKGYMPHSNLSVPEHVSQEVTHAFAVGLDNDQLEKKKSALNAYKSQMGYSRKFMLAFARRNEIFWNLPVIDPLINVQKESIELLEKSIEGEQKKSSVKLNTYLSQNAVTYQINNKNLSVLIRLGRWRAASTSIQLQLMPYRFGSSFAHLPKYKILYANGRFMVYVDEVLTYSSNVTLEIKKDSIGFTIPLKMLDSPNYILSDIKLKTGMIPEKKSGWRVIRIDSLKK